MDEFLEILRKQALEKGVMFNFKWNFTHNPSLKGIKFSCFKRFRNCTKGLGAVYLYCICQVADMFNERIYLFTYNDKLVRYYESFGFTAYDGALRMLREPRK